MNTSVNTSALDLINGTKSYDDCILNPHIENGIVTLKRNPLTKLWVCVYRLDGAIACRTDKEQNKAVLKAFLNVGKKSLRGDV